MMLLRAMRGGGGNGVQTGVPNPITNNISDFGYPNPTIPNMPFDANGQQQPSSGSGSSSKEKRIEARRLKEEKKKQMRAEKEAAKLKPKAGKAERAANPNKPVKAPVKNRGN
jgi:hypothetical protein